MKYQKKRFAKRGAKKTFSKKKAHKKVPLKVEKLTSFKLSQGAIVPDRCMTKLRYQDNNTYDMTQSTGSTNYGRVWTYVVNSLMVPGPNDSASGPTYYIPGLSEMGLLYNAYRVKAFKLTTTFLNITDGDPVIVGMFAIPTYDGTVINGTTINIIPDKTTWQKYRALCQGNRYARETILSPAGQATSHKILSIYCNCEQLEGNHQYGLSSDYAGTTASSIDGLTLPDKEMKVQIVEMCIDGSLGTGSGNMVNVKVETKITYYVEFFSRNTQYN